ncbi:MAG: hypothetical protein ACYCW6_07585, partial [Candidatus Xenobia bacterium]
TPGYQRIHEILRSMLEDGIREGCLPSLDAALTAHSLLGMTEPDLFHYIRTTLNVPFVHIRANVHAMIEALLRPPC